MHATHLIDVRESLSFRRNEGALPELLQLHLDFEEVGFDVHLVLALGRLFAGHVHLEESLSVELERRPEMMETDKERKKARWKRISEKIGVS